MLMWVGLVIGLAIALIIGVEQILRRLGIRPERPDERSGGLRDVLARVRQWQDDYARRRE